MAAGIAATQRPLPEIGFFFNTVFVDLIAIALTLTGFVCLIGVAFPKLWAIEMVGSSLLVGLMASYFVALSMLTIEYPGSRMFLLLFVAISLCPILWRISLLGGEWQDRRVVRKLNHV